MTRTQKITLGFLIGAIVCMVGLILVTIVPTITAPRTISVADYKARMNFILISECSPTMYKTSDLFTELSQNENLVYNGTWIAQFRNALDDLRVCGVDLDAYRSVPAGWASYNNLMTQAGNEIVQSVTDYRSFLATYNATDLLNGTMHIGKATALITAAKDNDPSSSIGSGE